MSAGREKFKKNKALINVSVKLFKAIPRFLCVFLWDVISKYSQLPFIGLRYILAKSMLKSCGDNIRIGTNVQILGMKELELGNNISIHTNCYIDASRGIPVIKVKNI